MVNAIPMAWWTTPMPMVDPIGMVDAILMVDPIPEVDHHVTVVDSLPTVVHIPKSYLPHIYFFLLHTSEQLPLVR